jgi:hypothetical protein
LAFVGAFTFGRRKEDFRFREGQREIEERKIRGGVFREQILAELGMEGARTGKARMQVKPETHRDEVCLLDCSGRLVDKDTVLLKKVSNANLDVMERPVGLNDEVAVERFAAGGGGEGRVECGFVVWEIVVVDVVFIAVGKGDGGLIELHFGH